MRNRKKNLNIHYGDIWMCDLKKMSGSVQFGYRPVFILSNNVNNMYANTLNIIPLNNKDKTKITSPRCFMGLSEIWIKGAKHNAYRADYDNSNF